MHRKSILSDAHSATSTVTSPGQWFDHDAVSHAMIEESNPLAKSVSSKSSVVTTDDASVTATLRNSHRAWEGSQVRVELKDLLPVLLQAAVDQSHWLEDFASETVVISRDFHEVLATFQKMRKERRAA